MGNVSTTCDKSIITIPNSKYLISPQLNSEGAQNRSFQKKA